MAVVATRLVLLLLGGLLCVGCDRPGDAPRMARIAVLLVSDTYLPLSARGLEEGMEELGYRKGTEVEFAVYSAQGDSSRLPRLVEAALGSQPDVICPSTITAINAVRASGTRRPVVFLESMYPVELGVVKSLGRPGGNYTGVSNMSGPMSGKRLELLVRMCPKVRRVGLFYNPANEVSRLSYEATRAAAERLGVTLVARSFVDERSLDAELGALEAGRIDVDALTLNPDFVVFSRLARIASIARARRIPSMGFDATQAEAGLLAAYGGGLREIARQAARQVDRVLRGESPADIPVEAPRRYQLLVNMKTAGEIGVAIPPEILYQADGYLR